jgi:hypothetical protein
MGEGVSKIIENCVTSFMDDPKVENLTDARLSLRKEEREKGSKKRLNLERYLLDKNCHLFVFFILNIHFQKKL